jgi:pimeloyl-ACP methyl ester carboxylesterase
MSIRREGGPGKAVKYGFGPRLRGLLGVLAATAPLACSSPDARGPHTDALPRAECGALAQGQEVGSSVVCGRLEVPADWDAPDGPSFELAVTHFFPREARPPAVLVLLGGPGDTTDGYAPYLTPDVVDGFGHELVFFDQRGTGRSEPRPECFELDGARFDSSALPSLAQCSARLAKEGVDAALFSTFQSVRDIDALRGALGYDRVGLLGMSYGTRLALQAMRDLGPTLESVVIDSVTPPQLLPFETLPTAVNDAVARMIDACAKSASCNAAHPDLVARQRPRRRTAHACPLRRGADHHPGPRRERDRRRASVRGPRPRRHRQCGRIVR